MLRLLDCVGAMFEGEALSVKLLSALIGLVRSADLALGRAAFHVIQASALKFEETCRDIVVAEGVGALAELAMRCDQAGLALVDPVLDLVALVCRGTSKRLFYCFSFFFFLFQNFFFSPKVHRILLKLLLFPGLLLALRVGEDLSKLASLHSFTLLELSDTRAELLPVAGSIFCQN